MPLRARLPIAVSVACLLAASAAADEPFRVIYPRADRAVAAALSQPTQADFSATTRDVLKEIGQFHHIGVLIDEQALAEARVSLDERVDLVAEGHDLAWALDRLLGPLALAYVIEDGVLNVTTKQIADRTAIVRAYDVTPLLDGRTSAEQVASAVTQLMQAGPISHRPSQEVFALAVPSPPVPPGEEWQAPPTPQIAAFKDRLVVIASPADHRRVLENLSKLAQVAD